MSITAVDEMVSLILIVLFIFKHVVTSFDHWINYHEVMEKPMYEDYLVTMQADAKPGRQRTYQRNMEARCPATRKMCSTDTTLEADTDPLRSAAFFPYEVAQASKLLTKRLTV